MPSGTGVGGLPESVSQQVLASTMKNMITVGFTKLLPFFALLFGKTVHWIEVRFSSHLCVLSKNAESMLLTIFITDYNHIWHKTNQEKSWFRLSKRIQR
jgi:hypothetical protein